ncbi:MAG: hypothetical protein AAFP19_00905 [Bacteroidota bacterium]
MKSMKIKILFGWAWVLFYLPLSAQSDDLVDLFTGDFRYHVPAMALPSSEGPSVSLSLSYRGGVQMNQKASWVGLGWEMPIGEIRRAVKGVPDEWNGVTQSIHRYTKNELDVWVYDEERSDETDYWGPLHFKDFVEGDDSAMDTYFSSPRVGKDFTYPDYDQFYVSGPGISGTMQAFLFDKGSLVHKDDGEGHFLVDAPNDEVSIFYGTNHGGIPPPPPPAESTYPTCLPFTKTAQFRFKSEFGGINVPAPFDETTQSVSQLYGFNLYTNPYTGQIDPNNGKAINAKDVVYFTNAEIKQNKTNLVNNEGFIDYPDLLPSQRGHDEDIGAFRITNEAGMTFHYALPVYMNEETNLTFEMDNFNINECSAIIRQTKARAYVSSWKLTAITGPDFIDHAPKGEIGSEDEGYWIIYDYTLWEDNFEWQTPYIGGNRNFSEDVDAYQQLAERYRHYWFGTPEFTDVNDIESISYGTKEMYYLNYIQSATHTAVFVKDIRKDEMGMARTTTKPQASLLLDRIVLIENGDLNLFFNGSTLSDSRFDNGNQSGLIHTTAFEANETQINNRTLASLELIHNYQLCKNYHGNIDRNVTTNTVSIDLVSGHPAAYLAEYEQLTATSSASSESGKLSIKKITTTGLQGIRYTPPYKFTYSSNNPDFDLNAKDYWGYYKSDYDETIKQSPYTSTTSAAGVDAWSMVEILTPLGGYIDIEYESDEYEGVSYGSIPARIFPGRFSQSGSLGEGSMEIEDNQFFDYLTNYLTYDVESVHFSCPDQCVYPTETYYFAPTGSMQSGILRIRQSSRAQRFEKADIPNIQVNASNPKSAINLNMDVYCGYDGNEVGTAIQPVYDKSIAAVRLKKVYGGGLRVKSITTRMTDPEGRNVEYASAYTYTKGIASIEPERFTPAFFRGRSKNALLYNRHEFDPAVGYSKVKVEGIRTDNTTTGITKEHEFINYDDSRYTGGSVKSGGDEDDIMRSNFQDYVASAPPVGTAPIFEIRYIARSRNISAFDLSTAGIGKIKNISTYDANGDLLSKESNQYQDISYTGEVFHQKTHAKTPISYDPYFFALNDISEVGDIPNLEIFSPFTSINAKAHLTMINTNAFYNKRCVNQVIDKKEYRSGETNYITEFLQFDPISGMPTKTQTTDVSTGEKVIIDKTYAYHQYPDMGPRSENKAYKNLLQIPALEKISKGGEVIGGSNTTYRKIYPVRNYDSANDAYTTTNQSKEWRPYKIFNYNGESDPNLWREEMEYSLFDEKGNQLESKYLGDRYSSHIYGYDDRFVIASVTDAQYTECAFSGAEDPIGETRFGGEVSRDAATSLNSNPTYVHTGVFSVVAPLSTVAFRHRAEVSGLDTDRKYLAKVWVYDNGNVNAELGYHFEGPAQPGPGSGGEGGSGGGSGSTIIPGQSVNVTTGSIAKAGDWHLLSISIEIPSNINNAYELVVEAKNAGGSNAYYDDFRFHPINSTMRSFVYQPWTYLAEYVLDEENFYDRTEYNAIGEIYRTYRETLDGEKLMVEQTTNFARN